MTTRRSLSPERVRERLNYDPNTGEFTWRTSPMAPHVGKPAGCYTKVGGITIHVDGAIYSGRRLAWAHFYGHWPEHDVTHANGDNRDCRIANIVMHREVTTASRDELTQQRLKELIEYDPLTGVLRRRKFTAPRATAGQLAGSSSYAGHRRFICVDGRRYAASRLVWLYVHGHWPKGVIDHINGNPADNRLSNLRDVPQQLNVHNQRHANRRNKTGLIGAHAHPDGGFSASIKAGGRLRYLGYFKTPEEAHEAYVKAKRVLHEGCTL